MGKETRKLACIGCGNMGAAIVRGIVASGVMAPEDIVVTSATPATHERLSAELGCRGTCDNRDAVKDADIVMLGVKPHQLPSVVVEMSGALAEEATLAAYESAEFLVRRRTCSRQEQKAYIQQVVDEKADELPIFVSIAAGVTLEQLGAMLPSKRCKVVRAMPNLPAMVGQGMTSLSRNDQVDDEDLACVTRLFESCGKVEVVPERLIDAVIAAAGSSPAYVCMFIEALADAAVAEGMPRAQAYTFAEQAVLGTAAYLLETGAHPGQLKDMVCSPGGTTIEAVASLEASGMRAAVIEAARASAARNRTL